MATDLRILILITKGDIGGAQMSVLELARELRRRGRDVTVGIGAEGTFLSQECEKAGIPYHRFSSLRRSTNPLVNARFVREFRKFVKRGAYDVLHINSSNALFAAPALMMLRNRPRVIFTFRGLSVLDENYSNSTFTIFLYRTLFRVLLLFVDEPVFVSEANKESALRTGVVKRGVVVHNGLTRSALSLHDRAMARAELSKLCGSDITDTYVVGTIGRLAWEKDHMFLVDTWREFAARFPEAVCVIVGDGPEREALEARIKTLGLDRSFFLVGDYPHAASLLKGFDLFVLPSLYEGLSITTLEALNAEIPMLLSNVGGNPEVVSGHAYSLFASKDAGEFIKKASALLSDTDIYNEAVSIARENAGRFDIRTTADGYEALYHKD